MSRDLPAPPAESFRDWWRRTREPVPAAAPAPRAPASAAPPRAAPPGAAPRRAATSSTFAPYYGEKVDRVGEKVDRVPEPLGSGSLGGARAEILDRVRVALGDAVPTDVPRNYRTEDERARDEIVTVFAERVAEYRATVHRVGAAEVGTTVQRIAEGASARRLGIPPDLHAEWRPVGTDGERPALSGGPPALSGGPPALSGGPPARLELVEDDGLSVEQLDALDGALTGCAVAIAETGTFVLDGGVGQGRRALTLVPDLHVCVVREDQVVGLVPEAVGQLEEAVRAGRPLTFVSGPSATSDIELDRVEGVHGPRVLHVVLVA